MCIRKALSPGFFLPALLGFLTCTGCGETPPVPPPEVTAGQISNPTGKSISIVIDYEDGFQKSYSGIPWDEGDTVMAALGKARAQGHPLPFVSTGGGATAFVSEIDGVKNEGGGPTKKNWLLWVNGKFSDLGPGAYALHEGDQVVWKFDLWPVK